MSVLDKLLLVLFGLPRAEDLPNVSAYYGLHARATG